MPSTCLFALNKENASYYSGEIITGTITLNTTSEKNVRDVCIVFLGEGKVKWSESHSTRNSNGGSSTHTTYYKSHEVYVDNSTMVHGEGILPAGVHTYTFNIPLPLECPTSFEGKYGHIRYEISLKLNRPFRFDNVYKKALTVIKTCDLNLNSMYRIPLLLEEMGDLCCCYSSNGSILYTLKIPYGAYAPGQAVKYSLHVANQTMTDIVGYSYEFVKKVTFTAKTPSRKHRFTRDVLVARSYSDTCLRLSTQLFEGQFVIPPVPPSTSSDSIIYIEYKLKFKVHLSGCNSDSDLKLPLIIGTIPIMESLPTMQHVANRPENILPTAPEYPEGASGDLPPSYHDLRPPSFEEAVRSSSPFIDTDVDERNRIVGFRPLYPMYNNATYKIGDS